MPTILSMKLDGSDAVRYFHVRMSGVYLGIARRGAELAATHVEDVDQALRETVIAITFAATALEALANELAEDVFSESDLDDFSRLRRRFRKIDGKSSTYSRLQIILHEKSQDDIPEEMSRELENLFDLRNYLVHYRLSETAGKVYIPALKPIRREDGSFTGGVNLLAEPTRVDPPLLSKLTPDVAIKSYNVAYDFFLYWCDLNGNTDGMSEFKRVTA